jgi:hypothetical protein
MLRDKIAEILNYHYERNGYIETHIADSILSLPSGLVKVKRIAGNDEDNYIDEVTDLTIAEAIEVLKQIFNEVETCRIRIQEWPHDRERQLMYLGDEMLNISSRIRKGERE